MKERGKWFAAIEGGKVSTTVVGRFVDVDAVDIKASELAKKSIYRQVPALESKIVGSHDISIQRVKDFNREELIARFPGAWEHYLEQKKEDEERAQTQDGAKPGHGTPLEDLDFIPRQNLAWLRELGFTTAEQIRDMSDTVVQGLGRNALTWRRKAAQYLSE